MQNPAAAMIKSYGPTRNGFPELCERDSDDRDVAAKGVGTAHLLPKPVMKAQRKGCFKGFTGAIFGSAEWA
jgi:hypothetical protein